MVYEDDQARERVQKLIHREGLSQSEFAGKIGRLQSNVSQILKGTRQIPRGFFADIMQAFPDLRKDWLLFGEGKNVRVTRRTRARTPEGHKAKTPEVCSGRTP